jgi:hypothetical protein
MPEKTQSSRTWRSSLTVKGRYPIRAEPRQFIFFISWPFAWRKAFVHVQMKQFLADEVGGMLNVIARGPFDTAG